MIKKSFIAILGLFLFSFYCLASRGEKSDETLSVELIRYKVEKRKKEKPFLSAKESKHYMDSLILDQIKVLEAKKQGIDTSFIYLNKVAEYSRQLMNSRFPKAKRKEVAHKLDSMELFQIYHLYQPIPQQATNREYEQIVSLFDSLYVQLSNDLTQINKCAAIYSEIKSPVWITQRQHIAEFDQAVLQLKEGELSKPFTTPAGVHMVQLISKVSSVADKKESKVENMTLNEFEAFLQEVKSGDEFSLTYETPWRNRAWNPQTHQVLFKLNGKEYKKSDFDYFSKFNMATLNKQYVDFVLKSIFDEQYGSIQHSDKELEFALLEYKHQLLLDELTERELKKIEQLDQMGLEQYFQLHQKEYKFDLPIYQGIVIHCSTKKVSKRVKRLLKKQVSSKWLSLLNNEFGSLENEFIKVEEGPFLIGKNACVDKTIFKQGYYQAPPFYPKWILFGEVQWYPTNYKEVEEQVTADYKTYLKEKWEEQLILNSDVEFLEDQLKTVNNH